MQTYTDRLKVKGWKMTTNEKESGEAMLPEIKASVGMERVHNKQSKSENKMAILNILYLTNSRHIRQKLRL